jgi:hypothetical protein
VVNKIVLLTGSVGNQIWYLILSSHFLFLVLLQVAEISHEVVVLCTDGMFHDIVNL